MREDRGLRGSLSGFAFAGALALAAAGSALAQGKAAPREVTFILVNNVFGMPAYVAVENGYWAKRGINVKLRQVASGREISQAMQAGQAQFGGVSLSTTTASARASGNMLKGVLPYYNDAQYIAYAGGRAIVGRADRDIKAGDPRTLAGKKIAYLKGSTNDVYLREFLKRYGVDIGRVELVNVQVENMPITIVQGQVDAVVPWEPYSAQAIRELGRNAVSVSRGESGLVTDLIGAAANEKWIEANKDLIERFVLGIAEGAQFVRKNSKQAAEIAARFLQGLNVADAIDALNYLKWDPRISVCTDEGVVRTGNDMIKSGLIKAPQPFKAEDFREKSVIDKVVREYPQFFSDLPPLPASLKDCKGPLP